MSVFLICEQAVGLVRGKRLILSDVEKSYLESLNYEALTNAHAQDEAVVCALHFARVRDRLLQIYPWTFARKTAIISGVLPTDCLAVLSVLVDGEPIEYEQVGTNINVTQSCEVHYTASITNTDKWSAIFRDVFCYSLAIEINSAVTGEPQFTQLLEQKAQELILRAHQIGAIQSETRITLTEELYNRAIGLARGNRTIKESSTQAAQQGADISGVVDWKSHAEIAACKRASESVRDRLLDVYAWVFARKSFQLSLRVNQVSGWEYAYKLPDDCLRVLALVCDGEAEEFEQAGKNIYCNKPDGNIRYTGIITDKNQWPGIFRDVYVYQLAIEVVYATTGNHEIINLLEQKSQQLIASAYQGGAIQQETQIPASEEIYGRAIAIAHGSENPEENLTQRNRREISVCRRSAGFIRDRLLQSHAWVFARKTAIITNSDVLPADCVNVLTVSLDGLPVENDKYPVNAEIVYTAKITDIAKWDAVFKDAFCYALAAEIVRAVKGDIQAAQAIENQSAEYIRHGYQIGVIRTEGVTVLENELYNRAINLVRGQRVLNTASSAANEQGIDNLGRPYDRVHAEISACLKAADGIKEKLLQLYPWVFARKNIDLGASTISAAGWEYGFSLPADCLTVLAVFGRNGSEVVPVEWEVSRNFLYCDYPNVSIRYTARIYNIEDCPPTFQDSFVYMLAGEVMMSVVPASEASLAAVKSFEASAAALIQQGYQMGIIRAETRLPLKNEICARAVGLLRGIDKGVVTIPDTRYQNEISSALRIFASVRDKLLSSYAWIFARKTATPAMLSDSVPGWRYSFVLPSDCLKVINVIAKDKRSIYDHEKQCGYMPEYAENVEITDYETASNELYANHEVVYVRYTSRIEDTSKWAAEFVEAFCVRLAIEIAMNTMIEANVLKFLEQRYEIIIQEAQQSGAIKSDTRLPKFRDALRHTAREVPYLDYSGIPTRPCSPLDYCGVCVR